MCRPEEDPFTVAITPAAETAGAVISKAPHPNWFCFAKIPRGAHSHEMLIAVFLAEVPANHGQNRL
jgi:hypothetical protein